MGPDGDQTPRLADGRVLDRLFAGSAEHVLLAEMGLADVTLVEYVSDLLGRFLHCDRIFAVRGPRGRRLERIVDMLAAAEDIDLPATRRREIHQHVGDFALFFTGLFPETAARRHAALGGVAGLTRQGKRAYLLAGEESADRPPGPLLRRLSDEFETCQQGLRLIRDELTPGM